MNLARERGNLSARDFVLARFPRASAGFYSTGLGLSCRKSAFF